MVRQWGSPDITRGADGRYLITYQQQLPDNPEISKLHSGLPAPARQKLEEVASQR
jgi:hypothetical protein